jgi:actin-related protein 5
LDEEGIKEKKKQKLMKAGFEARVRTKREKEREREERENEERKEMEEREANLAEWASKMRSQQEVSPTSVLTDKNGAQLGAISRP